MDSGNPGVPLLIRGPSLLVATGFRSAGCSPCMQDTDRSGCFIVGTGRNAFPLPQFLNPMLIQYMIHFTDFELLSFPYMRPLSLPSVWWFSFMPSLLDQVHLRQDSCINFYRAIETLPIS